MKGKQTRHSSATTVRARTHTFEERKKESVAVHDRKSRRKTSRFKMCVPWKLLLESGEPSANSTLATHLIPDNLRLLHAIVMCWTHTA